MSEGTEGGRWTGSPITLGLSPGSQHLTGRGVRVSGGVRRTVGSLEGARGHWVASMVCKGSGGQQGV